MRHFTFLLLLLLLASCQTNSTAFDESYLEGVWTLDDGRVQLNTEDKVKHTISNPIRYEFKTDHSLTTSFNRKMTWTLTEEGELIINDGKTDQHYTARRESDSVFLLIQKYDDRTYTYTFKKGWQELQPK